MVTDRAQSRDTYDTQYLIWLSTALGLFALLGGISTIVGWVFDVARLKDWEGNGITMKFNAALVAALTGAALLVVTRYEKDRIGRRIAQGLSIFVALIAGLVLTEHLLGLDYGIDTLLFDEPPNERATAAPGRMGVPGSTSFLLLSIGLLALTIPRLRRFAGSFGVAAAGISLLSLIGVLYGAEQLYELPRLTGIALQTALMIFALGIGLMIAVADHDPVRTIISNSSDGLLVRRLLPVIIASTIGLGLLHVIGYNAGLYDTAFGISVLVLLLIALLSGMLWTAAEIVRRNERLLRESEERIRTTLTSIGDGVITTDKQGRVINLNPVAESLTGWSADDAIGLPLEQIFTIVNETTRKTVPNPAIRALEEGVIVGLANHTVLIARDGTERPIDDSAAPIRNALGETEGCVLVFHDVTDRRRSEMAVVKSEHDLRDLFDNATIGIHWVGPDGTIILANKHELDMLGYTAEEFIGRNIAEFHVDENVATSILHLLANGESLSEYPAGLVCKDGSVKRVVINSNAFRENGEFVHSRCFTRDVTDLEAGQAAEKHLAAIVAASDDAIISKKLDGTITSWNQGAEHLFGHSAVQAIGEHISLVIPPERLQEEIEIIERLKNGERIDHYDTIRVRRDGSPVEVSLTISPIPDNTGRIIGASKVARNISERKSAERTLAESAGRLAQLADAMPQIVWAATPEGTLDYYNWRWFEYIDVPPDQMDAARWDRYIHTDDLPAALGKWAASVRNGSPYEVEFRVRRADGFYRWFLARALPVFSEDGEITRWFGTCTDINTEKETADELRKVAARLSEADSRKNEFLAMLAHELRNPLAPIRNALHIMRMTSDEDGPIRTASEMMERQVGQLVRLVDDLLDVSRITRGKIELRLETVELASIIYQAVEAAQPSCESGGVKLSVSLPEEPIYLNGDSARLNQAVGNLLNNACKFTDEGGKIHLSLLAEDGFAKIRVKDTGIGIAEAQLPFIFDMFVQADTSLERAVSGLGIGLTLVKNLVEMHGGEVSATSEGLGMGSEFTIQLPILEEEAAAKDKIDSIEREFSKIDQLRILVVDDNVDSAESLALLLEFSGHVAAMAHDGRAAVDMAASFAPEVILLDIGLPRLNGYEAARLIRQLPNGNKIHLIALTGWGQQEDRERSKQAGFDGHMVKPVDHIELMEWLEKISLEKLSGETEGI